MSKIETTHQYMSANPEMKEKAISFRLLPSDIKGERKT